MANNAQVRKIRLQGHEKFALRDGWLNKGIIMVDRDPTSFQGKNGPDIFGIGNNMVKSLRYWLRAFGLIIENPTKGATLTEFGKIVLENDPYFENTYTIWLLHSNIVKNVEEATSWFMFFNRIDVDDLEKDQIEIVLNREIAKYAMGTNFSDNSVKNDVEVLLNMYSRNRTLTDPEDKTISPFAQLNLIKNVDGRFSKNSPSKKLINEWVVLYELACMLEDKDFISIEDAIEGENGLSRIYQVSSIYSNEMLDKLETLEYIRINRTAGLDVIYKTKDFSALEIMKGYYKKRR